MDGEVYSARACLSARSCKLCLVISIIIAMVLVLATLIVVLGELVVGGDMCVLCIRFTMGMLSKIVYYSQYMAMIERWLFSWSCTSLVSSLL